MLATNYGPDGDPLENLGHAGRANISVYARHRDYHDIVKGKLKLLASKLVAKAGGATLRTARYATFGTAELSEAMIEALADDRTACLLANHGQIAFAENLAKALWRAGEVETLCHQYWAALQAGKPVLLSDRQMTTVLARFKTYGKQPGELKKGDALSVVGPVRRDVPKVLAAKKKGTKKK